LTVIPELIILAVVGWGSGEATALLFVPRVAVLASWGRLARERGRARDATGLLVRPVIARRRAAPPSRRAGWVAGWGSGNTATLIFVPKIVGATVRAASCHGWDDRGEQSKWDKNARNESHIEKKGTGEKREWYNGCAKSG